MAHGSRLVNEPVSVFVVWIPAPRQAIRVEDTTPSPWADAPDDPYDELVV
jgi:hypothetical protein